MSITWDDFCGFIKALGPFLGATLGAWFSIYQNRKWEATRQAAREATGRAKATEVVQEFQETLRQIVDMPINKLIRSDIKNIEVNLRATISVAEYSKSPIYEYADSKTRHWFETLMKVAYRFRKNLSDAVDTTGTEEEITGYVTPVFATIREQFHTLVRERKTS